MASSLLFLRPSAQGDEQQADPKVTPEITAKVAAFFKKVDAARRPKMDERMASEIQDIAKATGLGPEGVKALQAAAGQAEDAAQTEQLANQTKEKPAVYAAWGPASMQNFDAPDFIQEMADAPETVAYTGPLEQPTWKETLARILSPEQLATWDKARAEQAEAVRKEIQGFLDAQVARFRPGQALGITAHAHEIVAALDLPKERADAVNALADKAADTSMERWRAAVEKFLLKQNAAQRHATITAQNFYLAFEDADSPEKTPVWTEGIATLLTDEERARLRNVKDEQHRRGVHVLGRLMVALLDEKIAFTPEQRARLEPMAERLVQGQKAFFPAEGENVSYYTYSPQTFYRLTGETNGDEVRPMLDDLQFRRWQALKDDKGGGPEESEEAAVPSASPKPEGQGTEAPGEPEDLEQTVSDYLRKRTDTHHQAVESTAILRAEDAVRVAALAPAQADRLQTAARGTAEAEIAEWLPGIEETVRAQLVGATRENLAAKLASISSYYFQRSTSSVESQGVWLAAVGAELTEPQRTAWQAACDARTEYHDAAVAGFLTMQFDRRLGLSAEQWAKIEPLIATAFHDYGRDIERMFSYSNGVPWFLGNYYMFLPLRGVPEDQMQAVLTKEQWKEWSGGEDFGNTASYWDNIKQSHAMRLKQEEQAKKTVEQSRQIPSQKEAKQKQP